MEIVKKELARQSILITKAWETIYSNPKHLKGVESYKDKKRLWDIQNWVRLEKQTLTRSDFQFLETIFKKY